MGRVSYWTPGSSAIDRAAERAVRENQLERAVSHHIGVMPLLWPAVPDRKDRASLERNTIALLAGPGTPIDPPGAAWLGRHAIPAEIRSSGLWNVDHVDRDYDPGFLR